MRFMNRETQFPGKRKLIKVDANNIPIANELPIPVRIVNDEGTVYVHGTPITADNLNKGNWRDDGSVSFAVMENNDLPDAKANETQIVTASNGKTWIIPPEGLGCAKEICDGVGSVVTVAGFKQDISFVSDPQTQIDSKLDKVETATPYDQVYAKLPNGTQSMLNLDNSSSANPGYIVRRNPSGRIVSSSPINATEVANKQYVDTAVSGYVPMRTAPAGNQIVYLADENGNQGYEIIDQFNAVNGEGRIVRRATNGHVLVQTTPMLYNHATSKQYVDSSISDLGVKRIYSHSIQIGEAGLAENFVICTQIINNSAAPITVSSLSAYLQGNGHRGDQMLQATGFLVGTFANIVGLYYESSAQIGAIGVDVGGVRRYMNFTTTAWTVRDIVSVLQ